MSWALPPTQNHVSMEGLVDARKAAYTLNLPMYYLINAQQRNKMHIPYYRVGRVVRFKLSQLERWQQQYNTGLPRAKGSEACHG